MREEELRERAKCCSGGAMDIREYKVGKTYQLCIVPGGIYKAHVLAIVDDYYIVYKWYGKRKQRWNYVVEHNYSFTERIKLAEEMREKNEN